MIRYKEIDDIEGFKITDYKVLDVFQNLVYVTDGSFFGLLDLDGQIVVDIKYDNIKYIADNYFICEKEDSVYIYDRKLKEINKVFVSTSNIQYIGNGYFKTDKDEFGIVDIINKKGESVKRTAYFSEMIVCENNIILNDSRYRHSLMDKNFNELGKAYEWTYPYHKNITIFKSRRYPFFNSSYPIYGLVDDKGIERVKAKYNSLSFINDLELMAVSKNDQVKVIDTNGKTIRKLKLNCTEIGNFINDKAIIYNYVTKGVIDSSGNYIIPDSFIDIKRLGDYFLVQGADFLYGILDNNGDVVINSVYSSIDLVDSNIFICYKKDNNCYIFKNRNLIYKIEDKINYINGYFCTKDKIIDGNGHELFNYDGKIIECKYDCVVIKNGKNYSLLDSLGNKIIDSKDKIYIISNDNVIVNNKLVNTNQEFIKKEYRLVIYSDDENITNIKSFRTKEERDKYKDYLETKKKSKTDLLIDRIDTIIDMLENLKQDLVNDLDNEKKLKKVRNNYEDFSL